MIKLDKQTAIEIERMKGKDFLMYIFIALKKERFFFLNKEKKKMKEREKAQKCR